MRFGAGHLKGSCFKSFYAESLLFQIIFFENNDGKMAITKHNHKWLCRMKHLNLQLFCVTYRTTFLGDLKIKTFCQTPGVNFINWVTPCAELFALQAQLLRNFLLAQKFGARRKSLAQGVKQFMKSTPGMDLLFLPLGQWKTFYLNETLQCFGIHQDHKPQNSID